MRHLAYILPIIGILIFAASCNKSISTDNDAPYTDTIVYNVFLKAQNEFEAEWLKGLNKDALLDSLFASIYYQGAEVYDFTYDTKMTLDEVKTREIEDERFSRDKASVLQFTEAWRYNTEKVQFEKRVISVHIAYEVIDSEGNKVGDRGGFVIKMKQ